MPPVAGAVVLVAAAVAFEIFCLYALAKTRHPRYLPKWAWAILICVRGAQQAADVLRVYRCVTSSWRGHPGCP